MTVENSILIVEDEEAIRTGLVDVFIYHGFKVEFAEDGETGLAMALSGLYSLIILDVMLPKMNGFDICKAIREKDKSQPIIMLTAKTAEDDIIQGLTLGADDYVEKPFSVAQLVLRVQAVLRRSNTDVEESKTIQLDDDKHIDLVNYCFNDGTNTIAFTKREIQLIEYLQQHSERPVSREELLSKIWGYQPDMEIETRTVDIHVAKIRKKIEQNPKSPKYLVTIRGAGYKMISQDS